jgi:uncharacterized protein YjbI with pentapeptide repeats
MTMNNKLHAFLDTQFAPYGDFPSRTDVMQELLANLEEKFDDLTSQGKSDDEAYQLVVDSFGDVKELMGDVPSKRDNADALPIPAPSAEHSSQSGLWSRMKQWVRGNHTASNLPPAKNLMSSTMQGADLAGIDLSGADFSTSALAGTRYDRSNLRQAKFKATALLGSSFVKADLTQATFTGCDLREARLDGADLTSTSFKATTFQGATFEGAVLKHTDFTASGFRGVSFDRQSLDGVVFDNAHLKDASFRNAHLHNTSFRHATVRGAIFDGARMDKVTYAVLTAAGASVANVTVV